MTPQENFDNVFNHLMFFSNDIWIDLGATCRTDITANEEKEYRYCKLMFSKIEETVKEICNTKAKRLFNALENQNESLLLNLLCVSGILKHDNMGEWYKEAYISNKDYYLNPKIVKEFL